MSRKKAVEAEGIPGITSTSSSSSLTKAALRLRISQRLESLGATTSSVYTISLTDPHLIEHPLDAPEMTRDRFVTIAQALKTRDSNASTRNSILIDAKGQAVIQPEFNWHFGVNEGGQFPAPRTASGASATKIRVPAGPVETIGGIIHLEPPIHRRTVRQIKKYPGV